jgi:MerR family transcriptional regulator, copper efflux regulator
MLLIGQLSQATGLTREALRFYEQTGLIRAQRQANGYRSYPPEAVEIVRYIRTAQQSGFSLSEIGSKLPERWNSADTADSISGCLADKVKDIDARIVQLHKLRTGLVSRVGSNDPMQPRARLN